jgi:2-methylisocitrate lyase-like PEP mutase family enzyme
MITLADKAHAFRDLHRRPGTFVMPNPWDVGSARLLARMGFEALATTSAGLAFSNGRRDGTGTLDETIAHVARLAAATDLPLSADLERGFGDAPRDVARAIRLAAEAGAVGGSIEDATGQTGTPLYDVDFAADRVRAAAEAARDLPHPFTLTARAENFLVGRPDLRDTIARLQAYQAAGADVLFAPGLTTGDEIATVVASVDRPVNIVMGLQGARLTVAELSSLGVRRISLGSALARTAFGAFLRAAEEVHRHGRFDLTSQAIAFREINDQFPPMES